MAIDISKMGSFGQVTGNSAEIFRQDAAGDVHSGGTYWGKAGALFRSKKTEAANNEVRSQFLKALADTYGVKGYATDDVGRLKFEADFVSNLSEKLGVNLTKTLRLDKDFVFKDGYVTSGRPLTERRISAVNVLLRAQASGVRDSEIGGSKHALFELGLDVMRVNGGLAKSEQGINNAKDFAISVLKQVNGDVSKIDNFAVEGALRDLHREVALKHSTDTEMEFAEDAHWGIGLKDGVEDVKQKRSEALARIRDGVIRTLRALAKEGKAPAGMKDGMSIRELEKQIPEKQKLERFAQGKLTAEELELAKTAPWKLGGEVTLHQESHKAFILEDAQKELGKIPKANPPDYAPNLPLDVIRPGLVYSFGGQKLEMTDKLRKTLKDDEALKKFMDNEFMGRASAVLDGKEKLLQFFGNFVHQGCLAAYGLMKERSHKTADLLPCFVTANKFRDAQIDISKADKPQTYRLSVNLKCFKPQGITVNLNSEEGREELWFDDASEQDYFVYNYSLELSLDDKGEVKLSVPEAPVEKLCLVHEPKVI